MEVPANYVPQRKSVTSSLQSVGLRFLVFASLLMTACGDDGDNSDTILTGFSGILVFGIIVWVIYRVVKKRT